MLKKILIISGLCWCAVFPAAAQVSYLEEMKILGTISGQGLACGSSLADKFEMLSRAIMLTKAPSQAVLQDGVFAYNSAKADTYLSKQRDGGYLCGEILNMFDNQDIFKITLYEDGTLKMPDGKIITPKTPYDAKQIYRQDAVFKERLKEIYSSSVEKMQKKISKVNPPKADVVPNRPLAVQSESSIGHISRRRSSY